MENGVIETNTWLDEHFFEPIEILKRILPKKSVQTRESISQHIHSSQTLPNPQQFYRYLQKFGMYKPTRKTHSTYEELKQKKVWSTVEKSFEKYKQKWNGPDIPIYIFPMTIDSGLFARPSNKKSGVSFHDKLFLFLTENLTQKEIEALLVHEYHHVCRMAHSDKSIEDYTLLDSIILEGLAEAAVEENCGQNHLAKWCTQYSEDQLLQYWKKHYINNLTLKKVQPRHDHLLFGERGVPDMLGYAIGYQIIQKYKQTNHLTETVTFTFDAKDFLTGQFFV